MLTMACCVFLIVFESFILCLRLRRTESARKGVVEEGEAGGGVRGTMLVARPWRAGHQRGGEPRGKERGVAAGAREAAMPVVDGGEEVEREERAET